MQDFLELFYLAYKKLSADNIQLFLLVLKIFVCALGGLIITISHSFFSYKWLRNSFNLYVGISLPIIGLVITTVIGTNIALSIGMLGALSIVRFRTPIRTPYELVHYFSLLTLGISAKVDINISILLIILLSTIPFLIEKFLKIKQKNDTSSKQILMNFNATLNDDEIKSISSDMVVKNFSVKKLNQNNEISGLAKFSNQNQKDSFLKKWKNKIKNYDISLDEID
tara:strand:+ start:50586 stop:51260 length:675 start_codon:yes stop_codon:yes gene_type:complete